jgi:hypothetical protein
MMRLLAIAGMAGLMLALPARADEGVFTYLYASETMPKGEQELAVFVKRRWDKGIGHYTATDYTGEYEYGVTDRFTVAGYLMAMSHDYENAFPLDSNDEDFYPKSADQTRFSGTKLAFKYNFLSPFKDGIGFSIVLEPIYLTRYRIDGARTRSYELEQRYIVQKNFLDDTLVLAYNLNIEGEYREFPEDDVAENEIRFQHLIGASFRLVRNFHVGFESRHTMDIVQGEKNHYAIALGPNVHFGSKRWYATLTYLRQVKGSPLYNPDLQVPPEVAGENLNFEENERNEIQLKVGYNV